MDGPRTGREPAPAGERHPVLKGFEETDIIPFGGVLRPLRVDDGTTTPLTFVPAFPVYPPETAWMREPDTNIPGLVLNEAKGARIGYLAADLDRRYIRELLPDHANLLANLVRWAARESLPLQVQGSGLVDCQLYRQENRMILHVVNLTNSGTWRAPVDELIPIGPLQVRVKLPESVGGRSARLLVSMGPARVAVNKRWAEFSLKSILDHEVVVLE